MEEKEEVSVGKEGAEGRWMGTRGRRLERRRRRKKKRRRRGKRKEEVEFDKKREGDEEVKLEKEE